MPGAGDYLRHTVVIENHDIFGGSVEDKTRTRREGYLTNLVGGEAVGWITDTAGTSPFLLSLHFTTPSWLEGMLDHADRVLLDGREVGIWSGNIYSYYFRESLSMGCLDTDLCEPGTELVVEWGNHGKRIKPCRVTVDLFPCLDKERNSAAATAPAAA